MSSTRICKVCGAEYEYCHTIRRVDGVFRYQDVACCPEHGSIYLERVIASRTPATESGKKEKRPVKAKADSTLFSADGVKADTKIGSKKTD